jgi:hypothetical protein
MRRHRVDPACNMAADRTAGRQMLNPTEGEFSAMGRRDTRLDLD